MPERQNLLRLAGEIPDTEVHTAALFLQYLSTGDRASAATLLRIVLPTLNPYREEDRLAAQLAIAEALSRSESEEQALRFIVQRLAETMGWVAGAYFRLQGEVLRAEEIWTAPGSLGQVYREVTQGADFEAGVGLPGRVLSTGRACCIPDLRSDANFPRRPALTEAGMRSALAFPVVESGQVTGLLEFMTPHEREVDEAFLALLDLSGVQIGLFLQRVRTQQSLVESERKFRSLMQTAVDAIIVCDEAGRVTSWNPAAERMFGYSSEEMMGQELRRIIPDRHWAGHELGMHNANAGNYRLVGKVVSIEARHRDGREVLVQLSLGTFATERGKFYCGILRQV